MTQTSPQNTNVPNVPSSGEEIYNTIMQNIEPELATPAVYDIQKKYAHETEQEKKVRGLRYKAAFSEYRKQYKTYKEHMSTTAKHWRKSVMSLLETAFSEHDTKLLQAMEKAILES